MELTGILLFVIGFALGGAAVWVLRQKEVDSVKDSQDQLKLAFGDLSNEALIENQKKFLELAEDKFSVLLGKSDEQLGKKKELIDSTLKEMKTDLKSLSENTVALKSQMEESRKSVVNYRILHPSCARSCPVHRPGASGVKGWWKIS